MKDELIKYETAKLAKEKGFFQWEPNRYNEEGILEKSPWPPVRLKRTGEIVKMDQNQIFATTQSILQRWLREIHNIEVDITYVYPRDKRTKPFWEVFGIFSIKNGKRFEEVAHHIKYKTYEEALEEALVAGLKLIK